MQTSTWKSNYNISDAGLWQKMATISYDIFRVFQLMQYKFILQYSTDVGAKGFT